MEKIIEENSRIVQERRKMMECREIVAPPKPPMHASSKKQQQVGGDRQDTDLFKLNTYNRQGITHRQHINILALPKIERSRPERAKKTPSHNFSTDSYTNNVHLNNLAKPRNHYLMSTMHDHKEILSIARLSNIIHQLSSNKVLTTQQAAKQYSELVKLKQKLKSPIKQRKPRPLQPTLKYPIRR